MTAHLTVIEVLAIHSDQMEGYGGHHGLRDAGLLEAALFRPQTGYCTDFIEEAAALWESLAQNHPFPDGNKRTAFAVTYTFLAINGARLTAGADDTYAFITGLYDARAFSFEDLVPWPECCPDAAQLRREKQAWKFEAAAQYGGETGARRALENYRGAFLPEDEGESWSVLARERLRGRFIHLLATHGQALESGGITEQAVDLYLRGIDADPVVEIFHQGLMRCYQRAGRHLEAISAYRRFRQTLSAILCVMPSSATVALYEASCGACRDQPECDDITGVTAGVMTAERGPHD